MMFKRTRRSAEPDDLVEEYTESADTEPEHVAGWSTGAHANAAVVWRWMLYAALIASPLAGIGACTAAGQTAQRPAPAPTATQAPDGGQGPAGFAELYVAAYLSAGEDDIEEIAAYYPDAATRVRLEGPSNQQQAEDLSTVRARETSPGIWSVTVAAHVTTPTSGTTGEAKDEQKPKQAPDTQPRAVRYFAVPIAASAADKTGAAGAYAALSLPAEVAAPQDVQAPPLAYGNLHTPTRGDARVETAEAFLTGYLTGRGEMARYLAPGVKVRPITPAPYREVAVEQIAATGQSSSEPPAPTDGARQQLLITVRAETVSGVRAPLTYSLTLTARAGRWEIASLDESPALTRPSPTSSPS